MLSNLLNSGKKLSLVVAAWMLLYLLPDGSRVKSPCEGWDGSSTTLVALRLQRLLYNVSLVGRDYPNDLFSCSQGLAVRDCAVPVPNTQSHLVVISRNQHTAGVFLGGGMNPENREEIHKENMIRTST